MTRSLPAAGPTGSRAAEFANRAGADGKMRGDETRPGLITAPSGPGVSLLAAPSPAIRPKACAVLTASYGGQKNVLIRAVKGSETQFTALQVLDGQEESLARSFIRAHAAGGELLGQFPTRDAALLKAFDFCPTAAAK